MVQINTYPNYFSIPVLTAKVMPLIFGSIELCRNGDVDYYGVTHLI